LARPTRAEIEPLVGAGVSGPKAEYADFPSQPRNAHLFFGIYFMMTGLHGIHVLGRIAVWIWLLVRPLRGEFGARYFGPIDYAALYGHLVDLIWIYPFPLLYLIH
jgi:cytochrome c oxidase subunit 3